jgi:hypothetical protein
MSMNIIILVVAAVGSFVAGVLFGRRNTKKVEQAVSQAESAVNTVKSKL